MPRWLPVLLTIGLSFAACGGDRPPGTGEVTSRAASAATVPAGQASPAPTPAQPPRLVAGPNVTVFPDGSAMLRPPVGEVAALRRMPDGTFKRVCGKPEPDMREMIEARMRARRGGR